MATDVWVRNPEYCIKECLEVGMNQIVWDRGYLVKKRLDPDKFANVYFPPSVNYRTLVIGDSQQGAQEFDRSSSWEKPLKNHALWEYGENFDRLEGALTDCGPDDLVVVTRTPPGNVALGRKFLLTLRDMQEEYPDATIHVHGLYSWRLLFGYGYRSVDIEPRITAKKGKVILPNGREMVYEKAMTEPLWLAAVGVEAADLKVPRNRCMYNIKSALWAADHFTATSFKFEHRRRDPGDDLTPVPENNRIRVKNRKAKVGDKFLCDVCSLKSSCKYFRVGSVCSVPDAESTELARFFKTRDSDQIIEGLGSLLAFQLERLEEGRAQEIDSEKMDPEVTKLVNGIFDRGVKLAKLVNPALASASAPKVRVALTQNNNTASITAANPAALMAAVVNELESRGVARDAITTEMVTELLTVPEDKRAQAIEATVVEKAS